MNALEWTALGAAAWIGTAAVVAPVVGRAIRRGHPPVPPIPTVPADRQEP